MDCSPPGCSVLGDSPGKNTGVGALLQGIFQTQGLNPGLPHCRQILYHLSYQGNLRILEWVAYPFSRISTQELNWGLLHCRQILYQLSYQGSPNGRSLGDWGIHTQILLYLQMGMGEDYRKHDGDVSWFLRHTCPWMANAKQILKDLLTFSIIYIINKYPPSSR